MSVYEERASSKVAAKKSLIDARGGHFAEVSKM